MRKLTLFAFLLLFSGVPQPDLKGRCHNVSVEVDYLYWWTCPEDFYVTRIGQFKTETYTDGINSSSQNFQSVVTHQLDDFKTEFLPYEATSGLKIALYYNCPPFRWDSGIVWTHYSPGLEKSVCTRPEMDAQIFYESPQPFLQLNTDLAHFLAYPFPVGPTVKTKAHWDLNLDMVDLFVRHHFCNFWSLPIQTFMGLRIAEVQQRFRYFALWDYGPGVLDLEMSLRSRYSFQHCGFGPRVGLGLEKPLVCGVGLNLKCAGSMVYGKQKTSVKQSGEKSSCPFPFPEFNSDNFFSKSSNSHYCIHPITDFELGLYWKATLLDERQHIRFGINWEHHYFFSYGATEGSFASMNSIQDGQDLNTQGITLSMEYGY